MSGFQKLAAFFLVLAISTLGLCAVSPAIVVNEIYSDPLVRQEKTRFIELLNRSTNSVNLSGWRFTAGIRFEFPTNTLMSAGAFLVVAENPSALKVRFPGVDALGPWTNSLSANGELLELSRSDGVVGCSVDFRLGFPWPTWGDNADQSIGLIDPKLDPAIPGHWRSSLNPNAMPSDPIVGRNSEWLYFKGKTEPSTPVSDWRKPEFDDKTWAKGILPAGYAGNVDIKTPLNDMKGGYSTLYFRKHVRIAKASQITKLNLRALYDDGFKLWINGKLVMWEGVPSAEIPFSFTTSGTRNNQTYVDFPIPIPAGILREGDNVLSVQIANVSKGESSDCYFDGILSAVENDAGGISPGAQNGGILDNAPPAISRVRHLPKSPKSGDLVTITSDITDLDGVGEAWLEYQIVEPGDYLRFDTEEYRSRWTSVKMIANGSSFSATLPGEIQKHRRLVRYRVLARDTRGAEVRVPYADDPGRNFAYFVYDGVPAWTGSVRPGVSNVFTVSAEEMNRLPTYHLIATKKDVEDSTWRDRTHGDEYFWTGSLVYDGDVYEHIRFRPRGGVWRYAMGKNMWKFDFNRGHDLEIRDNWGRKFSTPWSKLNLGACIQQANYGQRGEQGMYESVGFRLMKLAGVPASETVLSQFRIIDEPDEIKATNQYSGDFWGLYLSVQQLDGRFLSHHDQPDGNLYKIEFGYTPNHLGMDGPVDGSDAAAFIGAYEGGAQTQEWWRQKLNLPHYFAYQTVLQAIHHYDIGFGKNYFYYRNSLTDQWSVFPWDLDLTFDNQVFPEVEIGGDEPFKSRVLSNFNGNPTHPQIQLEFRNRVRELRDLLINTDETFRLVDEYAALVKGSEQYSFLDADRAQWDYNPLMIGPLVNVDKAGHGYYYRKVAARSFDGMVLSMKNYLRGRMTNTTFSLDKISADPLIPSAPVIEYLGDREFSMDQLRFRAGNYVGTGEFSTIAWRVAEISRKGHPSFDPKRPQSYEIDPVWESGEISSADLEASIPSASLKVGRLYRVRARYLDRTGRSSHWSSPIEFTASAPDKGQNDSLQLSEIMYHPPSDGYEFLEWYNSSSTQTVDLSGAQLTNSIRYVFPPASTIPPKGRVVLLKTKNVEKFRSYHDLGSEIPIWGPFDGDLGNGGGRITLMNGTNLWLEVVYEDRLPWPTLADGDGRSLVPWEFGTNNPNDPYGWRASSQNRGSPGLQDPLVAHDPPSLLKIVRPTSMQWEFQIVGLPDREYAVQSSSDLDVWQTIQVRANGAVFSIEVAPQATRMFWRIANR